MAEGVGGNWYEQQPYVAEQLTGRASDCLATFAGSLATAEAALAQFRMIHGGQELDPAAQAELLRLQSQVDRQEALIQGATIMAEHLEVPAPDGSIAWGSHNAVAGQLTTDMHDIVASPNAE